MASPSSRRPSLSTGRLAAPSRSSGPSPAGSWTNPPLVQIPPRLASASDSPNASGIQSAISLDKRTVTSAAAASNLSASLGKVADGQQRQQQPNDYFASPSAAGPSTPNTKGSTSPSATPVDSLDAIPDEEKARILNRHLVGASERRGSNAQSVAPDVSSLRHGASSMSRDESGLSLGDSDGSQPVTDSEEFSIPYESQGGDVTHDLYKWAQTHQPATLRKARSASFSHPSRNEDGTTYQQIKEPGGFRRNYIRTRARERGEESPRLLRNAIDFLYIYGHFAGEDLEEEDDEDEDDLLPSTVPASERTPLLSDAAGVARPKGSRSLSRHRKAGASSIHGTASATEAVFMLLKGFVGTGVLFMGKAFFNGGILFSAIVLLSVGFISLWSFLLLVKTRLIVPGSFGDIGGTLYGSWMRTTILASIALSQIGFVAAYTIFVAENLEAFIQAVTNGKTSVDIKWLILAQMVVFLPLSLVRNLAKLSGTALIADAFILIGLVYIASNETALLVKEGIADVALFNPSSWSLLVGTAVFAFEGIGLIIPITESMKEPEKFPRVLSGVMVGISVLFAGAGVLSYAAYGSNIQTVVISNLPQDRKFVQVVQFLYSLAILLSTPLQLFPAVRIMENGLFTKSGKSNPQVKWQKNVFRAVTVSACMVLAWVGSNDLDKFVSIIGSACCIPLCFVYPPLLHLRAGSPSKWERIGDIGLIVFGIVVCAFTTTMTIQGMLASS